MRARALIALGHEPEGELMTTLRAHAAINGTPFYEERLAGVERALTAMRGHTAPVGA